MSRLLKAAALSAALGLAGCAGSLPDVVTTGDHPANPDAPTAPYPPPSQTLAIADATTAEPLPPNAHDHVGPGDNDPMAPMPGMDRGATGHDMMDMSPMPATAPATQAAAIYTCPMHPDVQADAPDRCPICGMKLVLKEGGKQ